MTRPNPDERDVPHFPPDEGELTLHPVTAMIFAEHGYTLVREGRMLRLQPYAQRNRSASDRRKKMLNKKWSRG